MIQQYPFECRRSDCSQRGKRLHVTCHHWANNFPQFCEECGWRMKRLIALPVIRIDRTVYRHDMQMLPGVSDKDKLEIMKADEKKAEASWNPVFNEIDATSNVEPVTWN